MARIFGATALYRLNENGTVVVSQGTNDTEPVRKENGHPIRGVTQIGTYADGGVWVFRHDTYYEIGRDDVARPLAIEAHRERAAKMSPPRLSGPLSDWS